MNERVPGSEENIWDDHCSTDIDVLLYAAQPVTKVVFWDDGVLELPAYKLKLKLQKEDMKREGGKLFVQHA